MKSPSDPRAETIRRTPSGKLCRGREIRVLMCTSRLQRRESLLKALKRNARISQNNVIHPTQGADARIRPFGTV
jgi:hypothetical protein